MILIMLTLLIFQLKSFQRLIMVLSLVPLGLIGVVAACWHPASRSGLSPFLGSWPDRHDCKERGHPDRPDRGRAGCRQGGLGGGGGGEQLALSADHADRPVDRARHDPDRAHRLWGSMAYAIMGGLLVASLLTLIFLPTLYVTWFKGFRPRRPGDTTAVPKDAPA